MYKTILSLTALIVLTSCTLGPSSGKKILNYSDNGSQIVESTTYEQDIDNTSDKIRNTEEFQGCMKQQSTMCIQTIGMQIAQKTKDASFCKELNTLEQQASCEFAITIVNAQEKNDEKLCNTLSNVTYMTQCKVQIYRQNALLKKDISLCDKINTITGSADINNSTQRDQCILQIIMNSDEKREMDCEKIMDIGSVNMCKIMLKNKSSTKQTSDSFLPKSI